MHWASPAALLCAVLSTRFQHAGLQQASLHGLLQDAGDGKGRSLAAIAAAEAARPVDKAKETPQVGAECCKRC